MRSLFLCSWYPHPAQPFGGSFFQEQARALTDAGVHVDVVFVEPRSLRMASLSAFRAQHFQVVSAHEDNLLVLRQLGWNPGLPRSIGGKIYSFLTERLANIYIAKYGKPDVIHVHCGLWAGPAAFQLKLKHDIPYVITEHHSAILFPQTRAAKVALQNTYSGANRVLSVSEHLSRAIESYIPDRVIDIVPNLVDTSFFSPIGGAAIGKLSGPRIAAIGSLDSNKSHDLLIRAFAKVRLALPEAILTIAGDGPLRSSLECLVSELNLGNCVRFSGQLCRIGVRDLLRNSDMLVHTSKFETFGITLIEAGSVGVPVITTASGGPCEIVHASTGFIVPIDDLETLASSIERAWFTQWDKKSIRRYIQNKYDKKVIADRIVQIYHDVV